MKISYKPLFRQLLELDMKKMDLLRTAKISTSTLAKLGKNEPVKLGNARAHLSGSPLQN